METFIVCTLKIPCILHCIKGVQKWKLQLVFKVNNRNTRTRSGICSKLTMNPANIRLDEDVFRLRLQKTSSRRLQDVLIKTNMFTLALCLQKTSSRRLQDVLAKTNIFVLAIPLQDVFKTFSRHLQDVFKTSLRHLQDVSSS